MAKYDVPKVVNQMRHVEGAPFGSRGGTAVVHHFPADGTYTFQSELYFYYLGELIGGNLPGVAAGTGAGDLHRRRARGQLHDRPALRRQHRARSSRPPVAVKAGPHRVAAAFVAKADGPVEDSVRLVEQTILDVSVGLHPGMTTLPHLQTMTIVGPMQRRGRVGHAEPQAHPDVPAQGRVAGSRRAPRPSSPRWRAARSAGRRPTTTSTTLMQMYAMGREGGSFEDGIRTAVQATIARPEFIFRFERVPDGLTAGQNYRINDLELAARLSYFLWGSSPDDALSTRPSQGQLRTPAVLERQVKRMLADRAPTACPPTSRRSGCGSRAWRTCIPSPRSSLTSPATWRSRCGAKWSCSSTASCARIGASSTCSRPTTPS